MAIVQNGKIISVKKNQSYLDNVLRKFKPGGSLFQNSNLPVKPVSPVRPNKGDYLTQFDYSPIKDPIKDPIKPFDPVIYDADSIKDPDVISVSDVDSKDCCDEVEQLQLENAQLLTYLAGDSGIDFLDNGIQVQGMPILPPGSNLSFLTLCKIIVVYMITT